MGKGVRPCVALVGTGYVGLATAVCFSHKGFQTIGLDVNSRRVELLRRGSSPIKEPGVSEFLREGLRSGRLTFTTSYSEAIERADIFFITVGTPSLPDGSADLGQVVSAATSIGQELRKLEGHRLVVVKSTVPPGTTTNVVNKLVEQHSGKSADEFGLCSNPEFLREGNAVWDTLNPDRVIIGEVDRRSGTALASFWTKFFGRKAPTVMRTNPVTAELIKYASNAFLATKVSFINQIADISERFSGADVHDVARGMGLDPRIGSSYLRPGLGYGGSCLPKDLTALAHFAMARGVELPTIVATRRVNDERPSRAADLVKSLIGSARGRRIAILGLSFKPDSDDIREAVSLRLIDELLSRGANVAVYDPAAGQNAMPELGRRVDYAKSALECIEGADCCIIVTEWKEFSKLRPTDFKSRMRTAAIVDGRRVFDPKVFLNAGIKFAAVGLGKTQR